MGRLDRREGGRVFVEMGRHDLGFIRSCESGRAEGGLLPEVSVFLYPCLSLEMADFCFFRDCWSFVLWPDGIGGGIDRI